MKNNEPQFNIPSLLRLGCLCLLAISLSCNKSPKDSDTIFKAPVSDTGTTPPSAVSGFSVVAGGSTQINLSWSAATDDLTPTSAITYEICQSSATGGCDTFSISYTTAAGATNYAVGGLNSIQTYFFRVRARDAAGNRGGSSNEGSATTNPAGTVNTPTFSPVAGSYNSTQNVVISTTTPSATVCYTNDGSTPTCNAGTCGTSPTNTYSGAISMSASVTLKAIGCRLGYTNSSQGSAAYVYDVIPPANVSSFNAVNAGATQINLTWTNPGSDYAGTRILRKLGSAPANVTDGTVIYSAAGTGFADTGLTTGTMYFYAAFAYDAAGNYAALSGQTAFATPNTDATPPTVVSSTPANAATSVAVCTGSPCRAKIILVFSESMNTSLSQTLTMAVHNGTSYITAPSSNVSFSWSTTSFTDDTLTINLALSWVWFPENSSIQYTLDASGLRDISTNQIAANEIRTFSTTVAIVDLPAVDTGTTSCYDASAAQACGTTAATFPRQDFDFTNTPLARSLTGPTAHGTYTNDYTTTDNVTSVVWKTCSEGLSGATCATGTASTFTFYTALNQCSALNVANSGNGYAGRTNWRAPTTNEATTLLLPAGTNPYISTAHFPATVANQYWTSTGAGASSANGITARHSGGGELSAAAKSTGTYYLRCVSREPTTAKVLTNNLDGTVTDSVTGLRWQRCSMGKTNDATCSGTATTATWQAALQYCNTLPLSGLTWRLPSVLELASLIDRSNSPTINTTAFPGTVATTYWTSTTFNSLSPSAAHDVAFSSGIHDAGSGKTNTSYVRCVATGP